MIRFDPKQIHPDSSLVDVDLTQEAVRNSYFQEIPHLDELQRCAKRNVRPMSADEYRALRGEFSDIVSRSRKELDEKMELISRWEETLWQGVENDPELIDSYQKCQQFEWRIYEYYESYTESGYAYNSNSGVSEYYLNTGSEFKGYAAAWFNGHNVLLDDYEMTRCYDTREEVPTQPTRAQGPAVIGNIRDWYRNRWVGSNTFIEVRDAREAVRSAMYGLSRLPFGERKLLPDEVEALRKQDLEFSAQLAERAAERAQAQMTLKQRWERGFEVTYAECCALTEGKYKATYMLNSGVVVEGTLSVGREGRYLRDLAVVFCYQEESIGSRLRQAYIRFETEGDAAPLRLEQEPASRGTLQHSEEGDAEVSSVSPVQTVPPKLRELLSGDSDYLDLALEELSVAQSLDEEIEILIHTDQELGLEGEMIRLVLQDLITGRLTEIDDFRKGVSTKNWKKGYTELKREIVRLESLQNEMPSDTDKLIVTIRSLVDLRTSQL